MSSADLVPDGLLPPRFFKARRRPKKKRWRSRGEGMGAKRPKRKVTCSVCKHCVATRHVPTDAPQHRPLQHVRMHASSLCIARSNGRRKGINSMKCVWPRAGDDHENSEDAESDDEDDARRAREEELLEQLTEFAAGSDQTRSFKSTTKVERAKLHARAEELGLGHTSHGSAAERVLVVSRAPAPHSVDASPIAATAPLDGAAAIGQVAQLRAQSVNPSIRF